MTVKLFSETKAFSAQANSDKFKSALRKGSVSAMDAKNRLRVYSNVMENNERVRKSLKAFSGFAEMPLLTNQYFNATVSANIRSFAGFLAIEKDMKQPEALLGYYDLLGVTDNRTVQPNIGYGNVDGLGAPVTVEVPYSAGASVNFGQNVMIIPGSVKIEFTVTEGEGEAAKTVKKVIRDDAAGNFLALPGIVATSGNTLDYNLGTVAITLADGVTPTSNIKVTVAKDVAGDPKTRQFTDEAASATVAGGTQISTINRFKLERKYYHATAVPSLLVGETDLMTMAGSDKAIGEDVVAIMGAKLTEVYQRIINKSLVDAIVKADISTPYEIDMAAAAAKFLDYNSRLDFFAAELVNIDTLLAQQSAVGVRATAYVCGTEVANWFTKMKVQGFKPNMDATFIDDYVGTYNDVPVLRQSTLPSNTGYAIHKTSDGQLAPAIRGIFLPLTSTPVVGSYLNPVQQAQGLYYQEAIDSIAPELAQKFTVTPEVGYAGVGGAYGITEVNS